MVEGFEPEDGVELGAADESFEDAFCEREFGELFRRDGHGVALERGGEGFAGIVSSEFEIVVLGKFVNLLEHVDGDGGIGPGGGDDGFETNFGVWVVGETLEVGVGAGELLAPIAEEMGGGGAGAVVRVSGDGLEEVGVDPAALLMEPEGFGEMMRVIGMGGIEGAEPFGKRGLEGVCGEIPEGAAGTVAGAVFVGFEEVEELGDAGTDDLGGGVEGAVFPGDAPDAAFARVASFIPEGVLHVAEDGVVPVGDVEGACGAELEVDGDAGFVVRFEDFAKAVVFEGGAVFRPVVEEDAMVVLVLVGEDLALKLIGPVAAGDEFLATVAVVAVAITSVGDIVSFGLVDERGVVVPGDVEVFAPAIDGVAPGVAAGWEAGDDVEALGAWVEAVDGVVLAPTWTVNGFDLGVMEDALLHVESAAGAPDEVVDGVVAVFAAKAVQEDGLAIGLVVAIGVFE